MAGRLARSLIWSFSVAGLPASLLSGVVGDPASPQAAHLAGVDRRDAVVHDHRVGAHAALDVVDRRAQPAAMAVTAHRDLREVRGQFLGHFVRGVVRAVVDDQHAELATSARWRARGFRERFFAAAFRHCKRAARRSRTCSTRCLRNERSERACLLRHCRSVTLTIGQLDAAACSFTQKTIFAPSRCDLRRRTIAAAVVSFMRCVDGWLAAERYAGGMLTCN